MALKLQVPAGCQLDAPQATREGNVLTFADDVAQISFGRMADQCQVVFAPDETKVGRQHCALRKELGRYRLVLNRQDLVLVDGQPAVDGQELNERAELQLGSGGPTLVAETLFGGPQRTTEGKVHQRGQASLVRDAEQTAHQAAEKAQRTRRLTLLTAGLAVLLGALGFSLWREQQKELRKQGGTIAAMSEQQREAINKVATDLEQLKKVDGRRLQDALLQAAPSVYLVLIRHPDGDIQATATAWVVDQSKGILATNGHVAKIFEELADDKQQPGKKLVVRSPEAQSKEFVIDRVEIHPGYDASEVLWTTFTPYRRAGTTGKKYIEQPGNFCDVALMFVKDAANLGPALPVASDDVLRKLRAGDPVGLVGYPLEHIALGGVNVQTPTPTTQMAYVTAVTDYFGAAQSDEAQRFLVQHAVPNVGGASGSPMINPDGQVIAINNAGNYVGTTTEGSRIDSAAMINYSQRADLFREMLEGRATAAQAIRTALWETELKKYFQPASQVGPEVRGELEKATLATLVSGVHDQLAQSNQASDFQLVGEYDVTLDVADNVSGTYSAAKRVETSRGGELLLVGIVHEGRSLTMATYSLVDGQRAKTSVDGKLQEAEPYKGSSFSNRAPWLRYNWLAPTGPRTYEVVLTGKQASARATVYAYLAQATPISIEEHRSSLVSAWVANHFLWTVRNYQTSEVMHAAGKLTDINGDGSRFAGTATVKLAPGEYFVVANSTDRKRITLTAFEGSARIVGQDASERPWTSCSFSVSSPIEAQISVLGAEQDDEDNEGAGYEIYVYRAFDPKARP